MFDAGDFLASDWMGGHKTSQMTLQAGAGGCDHIALGGTHIHHQGIGREHRVNGAQCGFSGAHRNSHQHQISPLHSLGSAGAGRVNHAQFQRLLACGLRGAEAGHMRDQPGLAQGERK